jgi:hypothetical protein
MKAVKEGWRFFLNVVLAGKWNPLQLKKLRLLLKKLNALNLRKSTRPGWGGKKKKRAARTAYLHELRIGVYPVKRETR